MVVLLSCTWWGKDRKALDARPNYDYREGSTCGVAGERVRPGIQNTFSHNKLLRGIETFLSAR